MPDFNDPLLAHLHTEIDVTEAIRADAKNMALDIIDEKLADALIAAEGDGAHAASAVTAALQVLAGELADALDEHTAKAMKQGAMMGMQRVKAARL